VANRNYTAGRSYEYKAKKVLEREGYTVTRAAGSHGKWDLIAVKEGSSEPVRCIQIKRTKTEAGVKQLFGKFVPETNGNAFMPYRHELWVWLDRDGWRLTC